MDVLFAVRQAVESLQLHTHSAGVDGRRASFAQLELSRLIQRIEELVDADFGGGERPAPVDGAKKALPRFEMRHGSLVRIGYSEQFGRCYERVIPKVVLSRTLETLQTLRRQGDGPLPPERIVLHMVGRWGESVRGAQVYDALGMLLEAEVLEQLPDGSIRMPGNVISVARSVLGLVG